MSSVIDAVLDAYTDERFPGPTRQDYEALMAHLHLSATLVSERLRRVDYGTFPVLALSRLPTRTLVPTLERLIP